MLPKKERIKYNGLFLQCYQKGKKSHGELLKIFFTNTREDCKDKLPYFGVSISKAFDKRAVIRNKIRRRLTEIYKNIRTDKSIQEKLKKIGLLVVTTKGEFKEKANMLDELYSYQNLEKDFEKTLKKLLQ